MIWPSTKLEKGLARDTGNEGLQATPGFLNSFVQFLDEKCPMVERHHMCILKFEPLHAPCVAKLSVREFEESCRGNLS